jgi:hypothetical protein
MSNYFVITDSDKNLKLHYAVAYLQVDRVKQLLSSFTKEEYENYYKTADYYAVHRRDPKTKALTIKDMPYTNLPRENNFLKFKELEARLLEIHLKYKNYRIESQ